MDINLKNGAKVTIETNPGLAQDRKVDQRGFEEVFFSKECYSGLFKAFVALSTLFLLSLMELESRVLPLEIKALEYTINTEVISGVEFNLENTVCQINTSMYKDCVKAKYYSNLNASLLGLGENIIKIIIVPLIYVTIALSTLSFVGTIFFPKKRKSK